MNPIESPQQQYAESVGAQQAHGAWMDASRNRQPTEELTLFPKLAAEDLAMFKSVASTVAKGYDAWSNDPVKASAALLLDGSEIHDATRTLVSTEVLKQMASALNRPADIGQGAVTVLTFDGGRFLADFNKDIVRATDMLAAGGEKGSIKVVGTVGIDRTGFTYLLSGSTEIKGGKQERTQVVVRAELTDGRLRPYDANGVVETQKASTKKATTKKARPAKDTPTDALGGYLNGTKVVVNLDDGDDWTQAADGVVTGREKGGSYLVDLGNGDVPVEESRIKVSAA